MARGHHGHHHRHAKGGSVEPSSGPRNVHKVGGDLPVFKEAAEKSDGFKRGGHRHRRRHGGKVEGRKEHERLDKRARGGRAMASGHHGVLSSAHAVSSAKIGSEND